MLAVSKDLWSVVLKDLNSYNIGFQKDTKADMIGTGKKDWGENMTKKKTMDKIFFCFYDIPRESYLLALYGAEWRRKYGSEGESLHFHNHLEVGYCFEGEGVIRLENGELPYFPQTFTVIPKNCPHAIQG